MTVITIPSKIKKGQELIAIPREEYERFLSIVKKKSAPDWIYEEPFFSELKKRIVIAKKELKRKKISVWHKP